ncbi:methylase [Nocardioides guangzhouensis]|uniref:Methylase n=1 Tax=Nocardioides guangzhouensis TaxID=2497878 RepID=A0A4Q4ZJX7_9ACTN|nr:methylase [Nocardioides guangzhouensis]RYP88657.1 methylase [Nocardioides guangzhouensis]
MVSSGVMSAAPYDRFADLLDTSADAPAATGFRCSSSAARRAPLTVTETIEEQVVKSRHRVRTYGEVFTPRHMVNRMLDLVREDLETGDFVDKTFLEPAAGHGNFLVAILRRKLHAIEKEYPPALWPQESLFAVASIYGIELLEDNHRDAKAIMLAEFLSFHQAHGIPCGPRTNLHQAAAFLIDANVVRGDTLTGLDWHGEEIQFSWWNRIPEAPGMAQREPFTFASLRHSTTDFAMNFAASDSYQACRIEKVHEQEKADD